MTPMRMFDVPDVLSVHEVPSEEVRMVPLSPTLTNNSVEVVVEPSSLLLQEMIVRLIRNVEKMISRFFTWFPIYWFRRTLDIPKLGEFYNKWGFSLEGV